MEFKKIKTYDQLCDFLDELNENKKHLENKRTGRKVIEIIPIELNNKAARIKYDDFEETDYIGTVNIETMNRFFNIVEWDEE